MTHLVRRPVRVQPPRRGRAAATAAPDQPQLTPLTVYRQGPPCTGPGKETVVYRDRVVYRTQTEYVDVHPVLIKLYSLAPYLFKVLDRPWKWLAALAALIVISLILGSLL